MESAIPSHLQVTRTRPRRTPVDYQPPYPSFVARHRPAVRQVTMAYFGVQHCAARRRRRAAPAALAWIAKMFGRAGGPRHFDRAEYIDEAGYTNVVSVAYWDDQKAFEAWFTAARDGWTGDKAKLRRSSAYVHRSAEPFGERL